MKTVIANNDFKESLILAIDMLCDAVSSTLGPAGNNVLINNDESAPFITNDGVTIAKTIESDDPRINAILEIAKEASLKTNDEVGDGTTTTLVLMQSIIKEALKEIDNGFNPIIVKNELKKALEKVIDKINQYKRKPSKEDLNAIACISAGDIEIGAFLTNIYQKMQSKYVINLEESATNKTFYEIKKGYYLEIDNISSLYFQDNDILSISNVYVLLINGYLESLEQISEIVNEGIERNKNILILADDYDETLNNEVLLYNLQENKNIFLFKFPDYGLRKDAIKEDIAILAEADIQCINLKQIDSSGVGFIQNMVINKKEIILINDNKKVKNRLKELKALLKKTNEEYEKEFISSRIARLDKGVATIYVGGATKVEKREKIMRFEDALCALEVAKNGITPGGGVTFIKISNDLENKPIGEQILKKSLMVPFQKIIENAGMDSLEIMSKLQKSNYEIVYNLSANKYENINITNVIDPSLLLIEEITNACSIACMLITTNYLVINENLKNLQNDNII